MNPEMLIPTADTIPVHWGWFQFLLILTFTMHLIMMNVMLGSSIIAFFSELNKNTRQSNQVQDLSKKIPFTIAFTVNLGVAPLLFVQVLYGQFIYVSSVLMAVYWFSIFIILILAYYSAYIYSYKYEALGTLRILFIGATCLILLIIAFFFSNNMTLMMTPERWTAYFSNSSGTLLNFAEPTLWPRYFHFVVASIAVGGLFRAVLGWYKHRKGEDAKEQMKSGMRWFTLATIVQVLLGIWFLLSLPQTIMLTFLGGSTWPTVLIGIAVSGALVAIYCGVREMVWLSVGSTAATIVTMILVRDTVRGAYLSPYFKPSDLTVTAQYSPLVIFLAFLSVGVVVMAYMLKLTVDMTKEV